MNIYIGIDNGLTGAAVALSQDSRILSKLPMPTRKKAKGNEVDAEALSAWLCTIYAECSTGIVSATLETPGKFAKGVMAISSMWDSYGATRAVLECFHVRHHRIAPQKWQKVMLAGAKKGDTKPAALQRAKQLWPQESWLRTEKCRKPDEGLIDAALIAEFSRISNL